MPVPVRRRILGVAALVSAGLLVALTLDVLVGGLLSSIDETAAAWVRATLPDEFRWTWAEDVMSSPGDDMVVWAVVLAGAALCALMRAWLNSLMILVPGWLGVMTVFSLKEFMSRARPLGAEGSGAFPSGHAADATIAWGLALLFTLDAFDRWRLARGRAIAAWAWPAAIATWLGLALVTGVGRVLAGVHWPTDVLAGWLLGLAVVTGALWVQGKLVERVWARRRNLGVFIEQARQDQERGVPENVRFELR